MLHTIPSTHEVFASGGRLRKNKNPRKMNQFSSECVAFHAPFERLLSDAVCAIHTPISRIGKRSGA